MKKVFVSIISLTLLASCSKSSTNNNSNVGAPTGTLTATIDGTNITFETYPTAVHDTTSGILSVAFAGYAGSISANYLHVSVNQGFSIGMGNYFDNYERTGTINANINYVTTPGYVAFVTSHLPPDTCEITITSISSTAAAGTFSGIVTDNSSASHIITNGKFNLNFAN